MRILFFLLLLPCMAAAQHLRPGFDKAEYTDLLRVSAQQVGKEMRGTIPDPERAKMIYRSEVIGLDNRWDMWLRNDNVGIISLRGTTANAISWMANFYAAMVPAKGEMQLNETTLFQYDLAKNPRAAVHIGWLISTAYLSNDMLPQIDACYKKGVKEYIIMGHSQGGAIAFLLTSYLHSLQEQGHLPKDIRMKTYCSAGPKPGNLYYAYDYDALTQGGWGFNVVNSADWVPETPLTVQLVDDFNTTNPFVNAKGMMRKQKFPVNLALRHAYNRMDKPARRALRAYKRYLGNMVSKAIVKHLEGYQSPAYSNSGNYMPAGTTIVLQADEAYYKKYPDSETEIFRHHFFGPYFYLTEKLKL